MKRFWMGLKQYSFVVVLLICILMNNTNVHAKTNTENKDEAYIYATKILTKYYQAIDQYQKVDFSDDIDSINLLEYINQKIEAKCCKQEVYGKDDTENYKVNFTLVNCEEIETDIMMTIAANIEFNYKDVEFDSGYGEEIVLILVRKDNRYKVLDWYSPYDDYDIRVRGEIKDISNQNYWSNELRTNDNIKEKQKEINNEIKSYYEELKEQAEWTEDDFEYISKPDIIMPKASLYSLNRSNMVTWANNNCTKASPSSGNSNQASYYDFSKIAGNYDCTNFVSHALLAGGAVVYNTGGNGISSTGWYYKDINNRSSSWSGVPNLYSFLTSNTTKGPAGKKISYTSIYAPSGNYPYQSGDILQFHNGSAWGHSTLITGYIAVSDSSTTLEATVTGRTSSTKYNKNQRQSEILTGKSRRVIKMSGYYK